MVHSFANFGYDGSLVTVEVDLRKGIPSVDMVGLSDGAVKETTVCVFRPKTRREQIMEFEQREYKKTVFPVRSCTWERDGVTVHRLIGSEWMSHAINDFTEDFSVDDQEAYDVDCGIAYYIPHDMILAAEDKAILDYIEEFIDPSVDMIFEEAE